VGVVLAFFDDPEEHRSAFIKPLVIILVLKAAIPVVQEIKAQAPG
jgi:hypothetical protein